MKYMTVLEKSKEWNTSERSVRNYCASGRVVGAFLDGKTWMIPSDVKKPSRKARHPNKKYTLLETLKREKESRLKGGIYHKLQVELTYNSNHMEGSELTHDETRYIFETNTIGIESNGRKIDDIMETINHFRCIDLVIDFANRKLSESFIKQLHLILKTNTEDSRKPWFNVGEYKGLPNEVGNQETSSVENVKQDMKELLSSYLSKDNHTIEEIIDFHYKFEKIHPFQDGNGRVGRLIAFKECLKYGIVPFIIFDNKMSFYYRGLKNYPKEKGWLIDTCLDGQDIVIKYLDYFNIKY